MPSYRSDNMVRMFLPSHLKRLVYEGRSNSNTGGVCLIIDEMRRTESNLSARFSVFKGIVKRMRHQNRSERGRSNVNSSFVSRTRKNCGA